LLIVTTDTLAPRVKMNWENKIRKALVYSLNVPFDVILQSQNEIDEKRNLSGHIVHYAMKEAVENMTEAEIKHLKQGLKKQT